MIHVKHLAVDLFCGLGGYTEALLAEGYDVLGFDIERHHYGDQKYPAQLVLQDVLTVHGSQFRQAALIVASPPCQEFSYMAMPWSRAKQIERALRGEDEFPAGYKGSRTVVELTALFDACFRIQREACEAAGRHIPLIVENVRGAQKWVGRSRWAFGSFHLWGDVPALMPMTKSIKNNGGSWLNIGSPGQKETGKNPVNGVKAPGMNWSDRTKRGQDFTRIAGRQATEGHLRISEAWRAKKYGRTEKAGLHDHAEHGIKQPGISGPRDNGKGDKWFQGGAARHSSKPNSRKAASAMIAKIPDALARHIARVFKPNPIAGMGL
jgi:hypothetical protein